MDESMKLEEWSPYEDSRLLFGVSRYSGGYDWDRNYRFRRISMFVRSRCWIDCKHRYFELKRNKSGGIPMLNWQMILQITTNLERGRSWLDIADEYGAKLPSLSTRYYRALEAYKFPPNSERQKFGNAAMDHALRLALDDHKLPPGCSPQPSNLPGRVKVHKPMPQWHLKLPEPDSKESLRQYNENITHNSMDAFDRWMLSLIDHYNRTA